MTKDEIRELDKELKGTRINRYGELTVKGFDDYENYEDLFLYLRESLSDFFEGDYWDWYSYQCSKYVKYRKRNTTSNEVYISQEEKSPFDHTLREQLAVIRNFIYRKAKSRY